MISSYESFLTQLEAAIIFRSKNFVNTDCDIHVLTAMVYTDIANEMNLRYEKYPYIINDEILIYLDTDILDVDLETIGTYKDVYDIVDQYDNTLMKEIVKTDTNTYRYVHDQYRKNNIDATIYFVRSVIPDISQLDNRLYNKLLAVMIEGIMWHIQASIPATADGQIINLALQRYYSQKTALLNSMPQVQYIKKRVNVGDDYGR